ncbi:MAG: ARMT1-like domain-containing protein [Candidatus Thermoplasmatota archaeon]|nr:ARMT1-like domain-containing protein [Candidatus Thermoplasmatota archaeon]
MKINPICVPCLIQRIIYEANQSTTKKHIQKIVIRNACSMVADLYDPEECSAVIATKVHKKTYELLNDPDPYKNLKKQSNTIAWSLVPMIEKRIKSSKDPLKTAILASIIGNTLDFGIAGGSNHPDQLKQDFDHLFSEGLRVDDSERLFSLFKSSESILFFTDNAGEIVFDKLLCQQLKNQYPHLSITIVVKGDPVLSDATIEDADELQFSTVVDNVYTTGGFAVGVDFDVIPTNVRKMIPEVDLILCKGMANYESFSETMYRPIVYLLRSKCQPIAESMNVPINSNILKLYE